MPAPYSYDLRIRAIEAVNRGERKIDVCRMFQISRNTLDLWVKREKETGDCKVIVNFQKGYGHKIKDLEKFREFAKRYKDKSQEEMAKLWGDDVTQQNISNALHRIGIRRQKEHTYTTKQNQT